MANKGMVYLVGAGPGDPGLTTVKGMECVQRADVLIYDRLSNQAILSQSRADAELIYVGKSPENHTLKQGEINQLIVEKALSGNIVTRLKGGDPFVFGRGGEEAQALFDAGIVFEVVPGITSAVAVPAYAGIPVTHRGVSSCFEVITGNEDPEKEHSQLNWDKLASSTGTLIFLMGMGNLKAISTQLLKHGMMPKKPAAVIQWGTTSNQRTLISTLEDVAVKADEEDFTNPSVVLVGDVVTLREKMNWFESKPLFGKSVLVTRSREQASVLSQAILELGGKVVEFPTIRIIEPEDFAPLDAALAAIDKYKWIVFTSVNGVKSFFARLFKKGYDIRDLKAIKICAIGPATRDSLESLGLRVDFVPGEYKAEEIVEGLRDKLSQGDAVLLPRADIARKVLVELLVKEGAVVDEVVAYRTVAGEGQGTEIKQLINDGNIDIITFTSSSTVKNFVGLLGNDILPLPKGIKIACIGPITAETVREMGLEVDIQAEEYTIGGLVKALGKLCAKV